MKNIDSNWCPYEDPYDDITNSENGSIHSVNSYFSFYMCINCNSYVTCMVNTICCL